MERPRWTSFIVLSTVLALVMQLLIINSVIAQTQNISLAEDCSALRIVDLKNHTITTIDTTTNNTISVKKFTPIEVANTTTNESLTTNIENTTIDEILTPENTTTNETLTTNSENATTSENLTAKFNALQGK